MKALPITLISGVVLTALFLFLSVRVMHLRGKTHVSLGSPDATGFKVGQETDAPALYCAIRAQANFSEYVPISLFMLGLVEICGAPKPFVIAIAGMLVIGRLLHPFGIGMRAPNVFRAGGILLNLLMLTAAVCAGAFILLEQIY